MKKTSFTLIIALMAVAVLFTGCKKEELNGNGRKVTLGVRMEPGNAKSYIEGVTPKWHANDQVKVNNGTYGVTGVDGNKAQIENVDEADNYRVVFPASIVTSDDISSSSTENVSVNLPAVQTYTEVNGVQRVDAPMGGYGTSTDLSMHNLCSILKVNVTNTRESPMVLKSINVTAESAFLSGTGTATVGGTGEDMINLTSGSKSVTLVFGTAGYTVQPMDGKTFYIVAPEFGSQNVTISVFQEDGLSKKSYSNVALAHNMITSVSVNNTNIIEGVLPGEFTVANGRKIYFSKGNLQATTSDLGANWTWSFAPHQYDYVGAATANTAISGNGTVSQNGTVDLFGWSTSSTYFGINNSTSDIYSGDFEDWGTNKITNGGNTANQWRTLTSAEWDYLLTDRSGMCYAKCVITDGSSYPGMIIFPDGFTAPSGITINSANTDNAAYTTNSFTAGQWSTLQNVGCVFLPAAGARNGSDVNNAGTDGTYWSSISSSYGACSMFFFASSVNPHSIYTPRWGGFSVRLVQEY